MANPPDALDRYLSNQNIVVAKPAFVPPNTAYGLLNPGTTNPGDTSATPPDSSSTPSSSSPDPTQLANDWYKAFFANYGLPADVQQQIIDILTKYATDPATAQALATQYLRGTDWYQSTFPGFNAGVNNGLFTDETGYRAYLNAINAIYNQYLGRHVSGDEITALLQEGANPNLVANRFQGQAYIAANKPEIQYLSGAFGNGQLTQDQLTALGNESAGIDTAAGQIQQKMLQKAQMVLQKIQTGSLATPSLSLGNNGLSAPGLAGTKAAPDVAA